MKKKYDERILFTNFLFVWIIWFAIGILSNDYYKAFVGILLNVTLYNIFMRWKHATK